MLCPAKVKTAACGRRWGKSESTALDIALYALDRPATTQIIIAPTDDQTRIILGEVRRRLRNIPGFSACYSERLSPYPQITFADEDGLRPPTTILARTAGLDGKGLRGRKAHRVIVDEAAYVDDPIMDSVVTPLLADYDGDLLLVSTPAGRNHFWHSYCRGLDALQPRYAAFQFPSSANPYLPADYLENEKATKPERTWQVEYLAEFADEEGAVFRGVRACVDAGRTANEPPRPGVRYSGGVDLARVEDFTVLTVLDDAGRQVYHERFNQISWERQTERIRAVAALYGCPVTLDSTGVGDPVFESCRKAGVHVVPFLFTNSSKENLIDALAIRIEADSLSLMDVPAQTNELLAYQYELTPSRNVRMNAPAGMHDDCVIALALAGHGIGTRLPRPPLRARTGGQV